MGDTTSAAPNPGSPDALQRGCTCAEMDNHHGEGFLMHGKRSFWISTDCHLHNGRSPTVEVEDTGHGG